MHDNDAAAPHAVERAETIVPVTTKEIYFDWGPTPRRVHWPRRNTGRRYCNEGAHENRKLGCAPQDNSRSLVSFPRSGEKRGVEKGSTLVGQEHLEARPKKEEERVGLKSNCESGIGDTEHKDRDGVITE